MPLKFLLGIAYLIVIVFLLADHARLHEGKLASVDDFRSAIFNAVKSHEGIIFVATIFFIGCVTGALII